MITVRHDKTSLVMLIGDSLEGFFYLILTLMMDSYTFIYFRNKVCLFFLLINALFVTIVFTLQQVSATSSTMSIDLPCADGNYGEAIEPISIAFTLVFGILLLIQFICMIFHRMATFLHILALTEVKIRRPKQFKTEQEQISVQKGLELVMDMQVRSMRGSSTFFGGSPTLLTLFLKGGSEPLPPPL